MDICICLKNTKTDKSTFKKDSVYPFQSVKIHGKIVCYMVYFGHNACITFEPKQFTNRFVRL